MLNTFVGILLVMVSILSQPDQTTIYLVGDSLTSIKDTTDYPETGWGMPFVYFWDSSVVVANHAKNGRSTKSFLEEGRWAAVMNNLQEGDWVLIQFGHNDEVPSKVGRYTTPEEFKTNLRKYVNDTRSKEANPILLTPVARRKFDDEGNLVDTHQQYSELVREVAKSENVPLLDLDKRSQQMLTELGESKSELLYMLLEPGVHPNYPDGVEDNTHLNELGARKVAQLVLDEMRKLELEIVKKVR